MLKWNLKAIHSSDSSQMGIYAWEHQRGEDNIKKKEYWRKILIKFTWNVFKTIDLIETCVFLLLNNKYGLSSSHADTHTHCKIMKENIFFNILRFGGSTVSREYWSHPSQSILLIDRQSLVRHQLHTWRNEEANQHGELQKFGSSWEHHVIFWR